MRRIAWTAWAAFFVLSSFVSSSAPLLADDLTFQARGEAAEARREGIRPADRSSGFFNLVGVHARPSPREHDDAAALRLSFSLLEPTQLNVKVWDPDSNYAMIPEKTTFAPGEVFAWPQADVITPRGVDVSRLGVLAADAEKRAYHPARLTTSASPGKVEEIAFVFDSAAGVELTCTVARERADGSLEEVHSFAFADDFGGRLTFLWNGSALTVQQTLQRGRLLAETAAPAATPEIYHLRLDGTIFLEHDESLHLDVPFYLHADGASLP